MKLTRRKKIISLGAITLGSGAIMGSNAFSSTEISRSISVSTTGDDNAIVSISVDESSGLSDTGGDTIGINLENLNKNGKTKFKDALSITVNDTSNAADSYKISIQNSVQHIDFKPNEYTGVDAGTTKQFDLEVNLLPDQAQAQDIPSDAEFIIKVENTA